MSCRVGQSFLEAFPLVTMCPALFLGNILGGNIPPKGVEYLNRESF